MSQGQNMPNGSIPIPISPRKKAAILIAIILLDIILIIFGGLYLPSVSRHSSYGRRGGLARPWNEDGAPGMAIITGVISLFTFGGNGLSDLHPQHACYSRRRVILASVVVSFLNGFSLVRAVGSAGYFLYFGMEVDRDASWLGVWSVCMASVIAANIGATITYLNLFGATMKRDEAEAKVGEIGESDPLLGSSFGAHPQTSGRTDAEIGGGYVEK